MGRGLNKAERLKEIERLLVQHKGGFSLTELAERLDVNRSTIWRDVRELESTVPIMGLGDNRYAIDHMAYPALVRLNVTEALMLYLAARRLARHTHFARPDVASALEKLALALRQPMTERLEIAADRITSKRTPDPQREKVIAEIVRAWIEEIKVSISHRRLRASQAFRYVVSPYLIEPSIWGEGAYLIGHSDFHDGIATFKIERIEKAMLTDQRFELPEHLDEDELLRHAWGIWYGEGEPTTVRLHFNEWVADRVKETQWHPLQRITDLPGDGCVWEAEVAEWREMVPWIRGWGADCEVVEPQELREELVRNTRRLAALYSTGDTPAIPPHLALWAKTDRRARQVHLLLYHLIDVGKVALALWNEVLTESTRAQFARYLGLDTDRAGRLVAFLAGLHDLGKASPSFQRKYPAYKPTLEKAGLSFGSAGSAAPHGTISAWALQALLETEVGIEKRIADKLARAVGGHHGIWPTGKDVRRLGYDDRGDEIWASARQELVAEMKRVFVPPEGFAVQLPQAEQNTFLTLLSGLTTVADWIGSNTVYFPLNEQPLDPLDYAAQSEAQARKALSALGWLGWHAAGEPLSFTKAFAHAHITDARPAQRAIIEQEDHLTPPGLLIVEAPTGIGKTEIALYLADRWAQTTHQQGLYIAMPTMATSNQMFGRVAGFLENRYPDDLINAHLVHSQALWDEKVKSIHLSAIDETEADQSAGRIAAMEWFLPRKRTLLAPFGVGTVDQTLLAVLQTKHFFVRLFGLGNKTVIFDEVHAYDTYMSTLFQRLLAWLRAIGASVIVLSATLPEQPRRELVAAYAGQEIVLPDSSYPRATWVGADGEPVAIPLPTPATRTLRLEHVSREPEAITGCLCDQLTDGGCAAVICNTVARAQEVYKALQKANLVSKENLILFHARFPPAWRKGIEEDVLSRFGKNGQRPQRAIVVATQVIEQSLDLDFDVMISDLAPADLIIQRAGRLHRHDRGERAAPRLFIAMPTLADGVPALEGADKYVYDEYILLRSYLALDGRTQISLPGDTVALIEAVYGTMPSPEHLPQVWQAALEQSQEEMRKGDARDSFDAEIRLVGGPDDPMLLTNPPLGLEEDNPEIHTALQALTRQIKPGVRLVCLHRCGDGVFLDPGGEVPIDLASTPNAAQTEQLLRRTIEVRHWSVMNHFLSEEPPAVWSRNAALRYSRPVIFDEGGEYRINEKLWLRLTYDYGLEIVTEEA